MCCLGITLVYIVLMHLLCNALRVFLGVMVVALVGKLHINISYSNNDTDTATGADVQVSCMKQLDRYIPPQWIMCLESLAHLLGMINFSTSFLIYCSVSTQFKTVLSRVCIVWFPTHSASCSSQPQVCLLYTSPSPRD